KDNKTKAVLPKEKTISNLEEVKVTIQIEDIQIQIKVTIIKREQPYLLLFEAVIYIGIADKNRSDMIDNIYEILKELVQQQLEIVAKIFIEVYQIIARHKEVYAMILETPNNKLTQQIAQIHKVTKLKEFANDKEKQKEIQITIPDTSKMGKFVKENLSQLERDKYKKLLASSLEKQEKIYNDNEIERRYIPKDNTYREWPVTPTSSKEDFSLKSRNIREWFKKPSKRITETKFSDKRLYNEEEFKLQKPPIKYKRTRTVASTNTNLLFTNKDKWRKKRDIRRKLFQESKNKEITSEDEKEINEINNIIEDDVQNYYKNRYNDEDTKILEIPRNRQTAQYLVTRNSNLIDEQWQKAYAYTSPK
ncbi:5531_t:CDS:2, partial [Cetraspora pellucida]